MDIGRLTACLGAGFTYSIYPTSIMMKNHTYIEARLLPNDLSPTEVLAFARLSLDSARPKPSSTSIWTSSQSHQLWQRRCLLAQLINDTRLSMYAYFRHENCIGSLVKIVEDDALLSRPSMIQPSLSIHRIIHSHRTSYVQT